MKSLAIVDQEYIKQGITVLEDGCWIWVGKLFSTGYGKVYVEGKPFLAHRISYNLFKGEIPDGLEVTHTCDTPPCVNPDHLKLDTHKGNMDDRDKKGRVASGDRNGLRLHPERVASGDRNGTRTHPETRPKGSKHGRSKLKESDIIEIRRLNKLGETNTSIAKKFNLSQPHVSDIVNHKTWKYMENV